MRLADIDFTALLPTWMATDAADAALGGAVEDAASAIAGAAELLTTWNRIDELPEASLDELAWALAIEWWDPDAPVEAKRTLIRQSDLVHAKKGTCEAVEAVIRAYFGDGRVEEWPEYGGAPHHYRVVTANPTLVHENQDRFLALLAKVARKSSRLDTITVGLEQQTRLMPGAAVRTGERVHAAADRRGVRRTLGAATAITERVSVDMSARGEE